MDSNDVHSVLLLYCLSKAAVLFGVKIQADEPYMTSRNISVVAICPGWCQVRANPSNMHNASLFNGEACR